MKFNPYFVEVFTGGEFALESRSLKTVGDLRAALHAVDAELGTWGDDLEVADVQVHRGDIAVTLKVGIPQ